MIRITCTTAIHNTLRWIWTPIRQLSLAHHWAIAHRPWQVSHEACPRHLPRRSVFLLNALLVLEVCVQQEGAEGGQVAHELGPRDVILVYHDAPQDQQNIANSHQQLGEQ